MNCLKLSKIGSALVALAVVMLAVSCGKQQGQQPQSNEFAVRTVTTAR